MLNYHQGHSQACAWGGGASAPKLKVSPPNRLCQFCTIRKCIACNYWYVCVKVHKNAVFNTKYLTKIFCGWRTTPSPDPTTAGEGDIYSHSLPPRHLWHLNSAPSVQPRRPWLSQSPYYVCVGCRLWNQWRPLHKVILPKLWKNVRNRLVKFCNVVCSVSV